MIKSENLFHVSGIVLMVLVSAGVITYTCKAIFRQDKLKASVSTTNLIYDPDHGLNVSHVCVFTTDAYKTEYENTTCHNKTMIYWYNPWLRHDAWKRFRLEAEARKRSRETKASAPRVEEDAEAEEGTNETVVEAERPTPCPPSQKPKQQPSEFLYAILVGLLIVSALAACWEVFRERLKRNNAAAMKAQERECTLADFTINRHLRKESLQQTGSHLSRQGSLEVPPKVTQTLIHQSSLDRAFPKTSAEVNVSLESRRNSVPSRLVANVQSDKIISRHVKPPSNPQLALVKRQSVDEDASLDARKKPRHFIRRH